MRCACGKLLPFSYSKNDIFGNTACEACLRAEAEAQWHRDDHGSAAIPAEDFVSSYIRR